MSSMKTYGTLLALAATVVLSVEGAAQGGRILRIAFDPDYSADVSQPREFEVVPGRTLVVTDLEMGDSVEGAEVELLGTEKSRTALRIQVQYETSVTIGNEGPHLDLLDWRHFTSDWMDAQLISPGRFRLPRFGADERARFPRVAADDLRNAARTFGGSEWAELVKDCGTPHDPPAAVDISTIRLRVVRWGNPRPDVVFSIEFLIPMGC